MEIFNNRQRSGYDEIVSYGPRWWTEFREMDANYRFAGYCLDLKATALEKLVNNQFPAQADDGAITILEKVLQIEPEQGDSLEERKRTVSAYYSGNGKLSKSVIKSIVRMYSSSDSDVWWIGQILNLRIFCNEDVGFSNRKIQKIIGRRMPVQIPLVIREVLCKFDLDESTKYNKVRYCIELVWWDSALNGSHNLNGSLILDKTLGPYFKNYFKHTIQNPFDIDPTVFRERFQARNDFSSEIHPVHRVLLNWWEELRTLDGNEILDGFFDLDQSVPPTCTKTGYRLTNMIDENVIVSMYIPGNAKLLDGGFLLDGNIKLNSGREEL